VVNEEKSPKGDFSSDYRENSEALLFYVCKRHLRVSEGKLTNNEISLSIFQHNLDVIVISDGKRGKLIISESNFPNKDKDIWVTVARCTKEMGKIMTLESLNMSLTLLNKTGIGNSSYSLIFQGR
jgi:hypothetical protein